MYSQNKLTGLLYYNTRTQIFVTLLKSHARRLTWLKKRLGSLGLYRRGSKVNYSSVGEVQKAIEVC